MGSLFQVAVRHVRGEHPPESLSSGTLLSADHHLPLNRHPQGSSSPDGGLLASVHLWLLWNAPHFQEPLCSPGCFSLESQEDPESGFPGARLPQIKLG